MRGLALLAVHIVLIQGGFVYIQFHNNCDWDQPLVEIDHGNKKNLLFTIPGKKTECVFNYTGQKKYQIGINGKLRSEFNFVPLATTYDINVIHGFDISVKIVPTYFGKINGTIIECLNETCNDGIHDKNEAQKKIYKTNGETIHVYFCPDAMSNGIDLENCNNQLD